MKKEKIYKVLTIMSGIITLAIFIMFFINQDNTYYIFMSVSSVLCFIFSNLANNERRNNEVQKNKTS